MHPVQAAPRQGKATSQCPRTVSLTLQLLHFDLEADWIHQCGEDGPPCGNCIRRELACTYNASPSVASSPATTADVVTPKRYGDELSRLDELCLMHHWILHTANTLSHDESDLRIWRDIIPTDGPTFPFLLDGLLALASLHSASVDSASRQKYLPAFAIYHDRSLGAYQEELSKINDDNFAAIFVYSIIIIILTIAASRGCGTLPATSPLDTVQHVSELLRGTSTILNEAEFEALKAGKYAALFVVADPDAGQHAPIPEDVAAAFQKLHECVAWTESSSNKDRSTLYHTTIEILRMAFRPLQIGPNMRAAVAWPITIDQSIFGLLRERDPMTMLIFIHYGVLYLQAHERWWARDFGCRLIHELSEMLHGMDQSWKQRTEWAREQAAAVSVATEER